MVDNIVSNIQQALFEVADKMSIGVVVTYFRKDGKVVVECEYENILILKMLIGDVCKGCSVSITDTREPLSGVFTLNIVY